MSKNNILTLIITLIITSSCATTELNKEKSEREVQRDKKLNELEQTKLRRKMKYILCYSLYLLSVCRCNCSLIELMDVLPGT